jgi:hypothetical protein
VAEFGEALAPVCLPADEAPPEAAAAVDPAAAEAPNREVAALEPVTPAGEAADDVGGVAEPESDAGAEDASVVGIAVPTPLDGVPASAEAAGLAPSDAFRALSLWRLPQPAETRTVSPSTAVHTG